MSDEQITDTPSTITMWQIQEQAYNDLERWASIDPVPFSVEVDPRVLLASIIKFVSDLQMAHINYFHYKGYDSESDPLRVYRKDIVGIGVDILRHLAIYCYGYGIDLGHAFLYRREVVDEQLRLLIEGPPLIGPNGDAGEVSPRVLRPDGNEGSAGEN